MLSAYNSRIWVGVNPNSDEACRQGMVNVVDDSCPTATKSIPLIIRPASAINNGLSFFHYRNVVAQLRKMGIEPLTIEINAPKTRYVYSGSKYEVIMSEEKVVALPTDPGSMVPA